MIPKKIHYCWFGKNKLPPLAIKCIESWKKYCPDYEIIEWNESNYDIGSCKYIMQAYEKKKWAYVSDYVRFDVIYKYGGVYFDTDVELIKPIDEIIAAGPFMGCEFSKGSEMMAIAPGLGLAANPGLGLYNDILLDYQRSDFEQENMNGNYFTVVQRMTKIISEKGFQLQNGITTIEGINFYPPEFFCPLDYHTGNLKITDKTISIHWYTASWMNRIEKIILKINQYFENSGKAGKFAKRVIIVPLKIINMINKTSISETIVYMWKKILNHS